MNTYIKVNDILIPEFLLPKGDDGQVFHVTYSPNQPSELPTSGEMTIIAHDQNSLPSTQINIQKNVNLPATHLRGKNRGTFLSKKDMISI